MNQLARIWSSLSRGQQISLIVIPALAFAAIFGLLRWKHESDFRVLYSGLAPEDASAVTQTIRTAGIEFRLDETGATVLVPSARVADARLALAGAGLPRTGRIGFELFDRTNLGASDFAEQVNYRRALEGELERTVATLSEVEQARIHVTFAKDSVFLDARQPSKATVVLHLRRNAQLSQGSVTAIANLVASAVDGLAPDGVAIIDSNGRLLNRPHAPGDSDAQLAEANLDYRHQVEAEFLSKINLALGPLLGPERFRASVNADCDFTTSEENEESFDPAKSAVLTSQSTEESSGSALAAGGTPGTASNLPRPTARASTAGAALVRRTENATYQPSRTVRHTLSPRGTLRRVSTAVLVDQTVRWDGVGAKARRTLIPPSAEVLKGVHDIVAGVTGFSEQRGDQITIETLPFESTLQAEPPSGPVAPAKPAPARFDLKQPVVIGGAVVLLVLAAGLILLLSRKRRKPPVDANQAQIQPGGAGNAGTLDAKARDGQGDRQAPEIEARTDAEELGRIQLPPITRKTEVLVKHIRNSVQKDPENVTNVLRSWIADPDARRAT
jgi:flagellar M-ring protein FliF